MINSTILTRIRFLASWSGNLEIVKLLLQNVEDINLLQEIISSENTSGMNSLMLGNRTDFCINDVM